MTPTNDSRLFAAFTSGIGAAVLSALVIAAGSKARHGHAAGGFNGPSQWIWGKRAAYRREFSWKQTVVGAAIHQGSAFLWSSLFEAVCERAGKADQPNAAARVVAAAAGVSALAYVVDYYLTPERLQPGFDKHLSGTSMVLTYAAFAAGLALAHLGRESARRGQPLPPVPQAAPKPVPEIS